MNDSGNQTFLITKEYRKFAEFCDACRAYQYIGLCYGSPGVGKTLSAQYYSRNEIMQYFNDNYHYEKDLPWKNVIDHHTALFTPQVASSTSMIKKELQERMDLFNRTVERAKFEMGFFQTTTDSKYKRRGRNEFCKLVIVDEADRLTQSGLELVRDFYDRYQMGVILIGMPGIEKRLSRYGQFYSRVGFVHNYKPINPEEIEHILQYKWKELGLAFNPVDFSDREALSDIIRITRGNFRLLNRIFTQIDRIMKINNQNFLSLEVVEAARENLIIGSV